MNNNSIRLNLQEISSAGVLGDTYHLTLYTGIAKAWKENPTIRLYAQKSLGNVLVVLKGSGRI